MLFPELAHNPGLRRPISGNTGLDVSGHLGGMEQRKCAIDPVISPQRGVVT